VHCDVIAKMDIATLPQEYARKTSVKKDGQGSFAMKVMYYTLILYMRLLIFRCCLIQYISYSYSANGLQ